MVSAAGSGVLPSLGRRFFSVAGACTFLLPRGDGTMALRRLRRGIWKTQFPPGTKFVPWEMVLAFQSARVLGSPRATSPDP